jgi:uncharacterized membrane protein
VTENTTRTSSNLEGISFLVLAALIISIQNIAIKWIGGDYSALEIVAFRSLIALPCTLLFYRYEGRRGLPTTQKHLLQYIRGVFLFLSYTTFMMGLAALPLANIEAIRFSGPLMITLLSIVMLGEKVGPRRWLPLLFWRRFRPLLERCTTPIRASLFYCVPGACRPCEMGSLCVDWGWSGPVGCILCLAPTAWRQPRWWPHLNMYRCPSTSCGDSLSGTRSQHG